MEEKIMLKSSQLPAPIHIKLFGLLLFCLACKDIIYDIALNHKTT